MFLTAPFLLKLPCVAVLYRPKRNEGLDYGGVRTHRCIGNFAFPKRCGRWNKAIRKVKTPSGKIANGFVVVNPICKSKEETQ